MAALPPRVADANAQGCLNLAEDIRNPPEVRLDQARKRLKVARGLRELDLITEAERREHEVFHARCAVAAAGVVADDGTPAWFGPAMHRALEPLRNTQRDFDARQRDFDARQRNSVAVDNSDPLQPILNEMGVAAPDFPQDVDALVCMTGNQMAAFLTHYGQPVDADDDAKRRRIRKFIGIRP